MCIFDNFTDITLNFSDLVGATICNQDGGRLGRLSDFFVNYEEIYPTVIALQIQKNRRFFYVDWSNVQLFSPKKIIVNNNSPIGRSRTYPKTDRNIIKNLLVEQYSIYPIEYPPVGKIILDRQIVDISGKKVVRVNDIQFIRIGKVLRITHAEIGLRSLIRRIGLETPVDFLLNLVHPNSKYLTGNTLINWKFVHAIPDRTVQSNVKLNMSNEEIKALHPADLADILEDLDMHGRELIFRKLDPELAADTLSEIDPEIQHLFLQNEDPLAAAKIIENMGTDEAADILNELSDEKRGEIISQIEDDEIQEEIQELLEYDDDTAGGLMSSEVFQVPPDTRKNDIMNIIQDKHEDIESIYDIYIIDNKHKLIGTCPLNKILIQKENITLKDIMISNDIKSLTPDIHWWDVASYMSKYNLINVPIVNKNFELLGSISVDDILPWLLDER